MNSDIKTVPPTTSPEVDSSAVPGLDVITPPNEIDTTALDDDTNHEHQKTDVLGILSLICVFLALWPAGIILGFLGASKAKKAKHSLRLSRAGWIINMLLMLAAIPLLFLLAEYNLKNSQASLRDDERAVDINTLYEKLEEYFETNFGYPNTLVNFTSTNEQNLISPNGSVIRINKVVSSEAEAEASTNPNEEIQYTYTPYGKPNCINDCDGYVLKSFIEKRTDTRLNPYVIYGSDNL